MHDKHIRGVPLPHASNATGMAMASKTQHARRVRLLLEPLERRDLMAGDFGHEISIASLLASNARSQDLSADFADVGPQFSSSYGFVNQAPSGADATFNVVENGSHVFSLADFGFTDSDLYHLPASPPPSSLAADDVLVLYNSASAEGLEIANYYAQVHPGVQLLGITGVDPASEEITADAYLSTIRPQVLAALDSSIDVIVTTKGLPLRITVTETPLPLNSNYVDALGITRTVYSWKVYSSLESELARIDTISTWQMMGDQGILQAGQLARNPYYLTDGAFSYASYDTRLASRLDGYTVADVTAAIDRAQLAMIGPYNNPGGPFYFLVDNDPSKSYSQWMDNLVNNVLIPAGMPLVYDNTSAFVGTAPGPVIGYDSHGVHQASAPADYLYNGLAVTLADGAVFQSWESYNAYSFSTSNPHGNQGQIAEWLQIGGTAGVGHVEEPTASPNTVSNEDQLFQMMIGGYTFAEAAWSATRQLSFVNTVVGDPLMRWQMLATGGDSLAAVKITSLPTAGTLTRGGVAVASGQFISAADILAGLLVFTPAAGASGTSYAGFTFQVQDTGSTAGGGANLDPTPNTITFDVTPSDGFPPAAFWRFDAPSGSTVGDSSGNNNTGTLTGGALFGAGHSGGGLLLNGSPQRVVVPDAAGLDVTDAITISAWISPGKSASQTILKKARTDSVDGYELSLNSNGKVFVRFNQDTKGDTFRLNSTSKYPANGSTWLHVAATYDGTTIRLFINGQLQASKAATFTIKTNDTPLGIGAQDDGKNALKGRIDDVLLADRALSSQEILALYQGSIPDGWAVNQPPIVSAGPDKVTRLANSVALAGTISDDGLPNGSTSTAEWSVVGGPGSVIFGDSTSASTTATFGAIGTYVLRLSASDGELSASDDVTVTVLANDSLAGTVGDWRFDEGSGTTTGDSSPSGNQGTLVGGASFGTGHSGSAVVLASSAERVVVPDAPSLDIAGAITIGAWIAPSSTATQAVIKKGRTDSVDGYELSLSSTGKIFVRFNQDTKGNAYRLDSLSSYATNGSWTHVVATYDGATIRLYVNGQLQASKAATFTIHANNTALAIGAQDDGKYAMPGRIDGALVVNRALSAAEINTLYQLG